MAPMQGESGAGGVGPSGDWSTDGDFDAESTFIFRESDDGAAGGAPAAAGGAAAGGAAAGGASGAAPSDAELDKLAGRLYERLRHKLRRELLDDRERAGFALDRVR